MGCSGGLLSPIAEAGSRIRESWLFGRPLPGDNLVLDLVIDVLGNDLAISEIVLAVIWPMGNDRLGTGGADAGQLVEFFSTRRVYINQFSRLLGFAGGLFCRARRGGRRGARGFGRRRGLRSHGHRQKQRQPYRAPIASR